MDIVDEAQLSEQERISSLISSRFMEGLALTGLCHNCIDPVTQGHFCDADCRDDYEKRQQYHIRRTRAAKQRMLTGFE
ncbi:hypothetical protein SAMN05428958_1134 [Pantoea sesami]|nr:hypothetical protein SAMN05428958_1134 [Pantoea sesami]